MMQRRSQGVILAASLGVGMALLPGQASAYVQTNLVSDLPGMAPVTDLNLVNPWGMSYGPGGPIWVSDNHSGVSTLYTGSGQPFPVGSPLVVTIPPPSGGTPPAAPTGQVHNSDPTNFKGAAFIFATEDGTISYWKSSFGTNALLSPIDNSGAGAVYKGLAIAGSGANARIYATNFNSGKVEAYDSNFAKVSLPFTPPANIPADFAPFGIQNVGGNLVVTYAKQDAAKHDDEAGPGNGYVAVYDTNGNLIGSGTLIAQGALNSPWGISLAPSDFGQFSNDLLVGNFGDGTINAFDPTTGALLGTLDDPSGNPISIEGLWGLLFGNGGLGGAMNELFFTAGISGPGGAKEDHGLFGDIIVPEPSTMALLIPAMAWLGLRRRRA